MIARLATLVLFSVALPARADVTVYFGAPAAGALEETTTPEGSSVIPAEGSTVIPAGEPPAIPEPAAVTPRVERSPEPRPTEPRAPRAPEPTTDEPSPAVAAPATPPDVSDPAVGPAAAVVGPGACPEPVEIVRVGDGSGEHASLVLLGCDGSPDAASLRELSLLARPSRVDRPRASVLAEHESDDDWVAPRIRRLHAGLLARLRAIADRFPGHRIEIVSGFRPDARDGSRHRLGRAIDLRVEGVTVSELDAFARTIEATGVGHYPTTEFVHVDVRSRSAHWIDVSGPGEAPVMVREETVSPETAPAESDEDATGEEVDADAYARAAAALLEGVVLELR